MCSDRSLGRKHNIQFILSDKFVLNLVALNLRNSGKNMPKQGDIFAEFCTKVSNE